MDPAGVGGFHADCPRPFRVTLASEIITITGLLLFLYVAEPLLSHGAALRSWTVYLPGVAADGLTQASQAGVRLLPPWQGGLVLAGWAAAIAAGTILVGRRDITYRIRHPAPAPGGNSPGDG